MQRWLISHAHSNYADICSFPHFYYPAVVPSFRHGACPMIDTNQSYVCMVSIHAGLAAKRNRKQTREVKTREEKKKKKNTNIGWLISPHHHPLPFHVRPAQSIVRKNIANMQPDLYARRHTPLDSRWLVKLTHGHHDGGNCSCFASAYCVHLMGTASEGT